jgi:hypothetical protein
MNKGTGRKEKKGEIINDRRLIHNDVILIGVAVWIRIQKNVTNQSCESKLFCIR